MSIHYIDLDKDYTDRFDLAKFLEFSNDSFDILTSFFIKELKNLPSRGNTLITIEENNPELLSYLIYGDTQYDWVLMEYNSLTNISELKNGMTINYPSLTELESLYFSLVSKESNSIKQKANNINQAIALNSSLGNTTNNNTQNIISDSNYVFNFINTDIVTIDHPLNKRVSVQAFEFDIDGNEVNMEVPFTYPQGLETSRVIVYLSEPKTGVIVLN